MLGYLCYIIMIVWPSLRNKTSSYSNATEHVKFFVSIDNVFFGLLFTFQLEHLNLEIYMYIVDQLGNQAESIHKDSEYHSRNVDKNGVAGNISTMKEIIY